jgi:YVTN family beta-propeller protein
VWGATLKGKTRGILLISIVGILGFALINALPSGMPNLSPQQNTATSAASNGGITKTTGTSSPAGSSGGSVRAPEDALFKSPIQMAITRDGRRLVVACERSNEVLVIDTRQQKVVGRVQVGKFPFGLAFSPDETRLYVGNRRDNTVSVVDFESLKVLETFPVGVDPHQLKTDSSGQFLYVTNLRNNNISIIKATDFTEVKRLTSGTTPFGLALSPDGGTLYVSHQLSNPVPFRTPPVLELTVVDTKHQLVSGRHRLLSTVVGQDVAVSPDNRFVVVALELPKNLLPETQVYQGWMVTYGLAILEAGSKGRVAYLLLDEPNLYFADPYGLAFSPDGRRLYVSSSGVDFVSVVNMEKVYRILKVQDGKIGLPDETLKVYARHLALSSEYVEARIPTGNNPKDLVVSPDGRWVYVANRLSDSVLVIDTATNQPSATIDLGGPRSDTVLRRGEKLFNYSTISFQKQLSCNTCHPEYHLDGLLYDIVGPADGMGQNLVDNRTMRNIAETGPFKWNGKNPTLARQDGPRAAQLFFRSHGFEKEQLKEIVRFVESIPLERNQFNHPDGTLNEFQESGKQFFERSWTIDGRYIPVGNRCIACHLPPHFTDQKMHDVGTKTYSDVESSFDTPQVANVFDGGPFLHDGRCYSLEEIWTVNNPDDLHGVTNEMDKRMLNELIEYTKTLSAREPMSDKEFMATIFPVPRKGAVALAVEGVSKPVEPPAKYVGSKVCANCHLSQYKTWLGTKHARTFVFLGSQTALKVAKAAEIKASSPQHSSFCLNCHGTAADVDPAYMAPDFRIEEGVSCEHCHGPGEKYSKEEVMKDKQKAAAMGLKKLVPQDCMTCHQPKPSHSLLGRPPFDFPAFWTKIAHGRQKGSESKPIVDYGGM